MGFYGRIGRRSMWKLHHGSNRRCNLVPASSSCKGVCTIAGLALQPLNPVATFIFLEFIIHESEEERRIMKHWYALQSKFQQENLLWEQLCMRDIEAYYPRISVNPVNPRAKKIKPYFPGYMFVNVDLEQVGSSTFQWMPGVARMVSFGNEFAPIPDHLMQAIRERVDEINAVESRSFENFKPGDLVVLRSGTFAGYEAIFDSRLPGHDRVRVLLQLLENQQIRMVVPVRQISHAVQH